MTCVASGDAFTHPAMGVRQPEAREKRCETHGPTGRPRPTGSCDGVPHRGAHRSVSHPRLNLDDAGSVDRKRTEGVPEVVEAQLAQSGSYYCGLESPAERRPVEVLACLTREHEILGACEARPLAQSRQRLRHLRGEWDRLPSRTSASRLSRGCSSPAPAATGARNRHRATAGQQLARRRPAKAATR